MIYRPWYWRLKIDLMQNNCNYWNWHRCQYIQKLIDLGILILKRLLQALCRTPWSIAFFDESTKLLFGQSSVSEYIQLSTFDKRSWQNFRSESGSYDFANWCLSLGLWQMKAGAVKNSITLNGLTFSLFLRFQNYIQFVSRQYIMI